MLAEPNEMVHADAASNLRTQITQLVSLKDVDVRLGWLGLGRSRSDCSQDALWD